LSDDEVPDLFGEKLAQKLAGIAAELGKQQMQMFFQRLDEATEKAGTRVDNRGMTITADKILQMIEMTEVDFDQRGKPKSSFMVHPDLLETASSLLVVDQGEK